jgi:hypothetical protein
VDFRSENERERVVDPGAREVVAKLGAAAAAKAGSKRAAIRQSCNVLMRVIPSQSRQTKGGKSREAWLKPSLLNQHPIEGQENTHPSLTNVAHPALYVSWVDQVLSPPT